MTKLEQLAKIGQAVWYDYIRRDFVENGELQSLINMGLRGMTSNPSIFEKAISGSDLYDEDIRRVSSQTTVLEEIYESLALHDISRAADLMLPVYKSSRALDGYVSLEVNPSLAYDTEGTVEEAKRLFKTLGRPNIMIKIPATKEGLPAITEVIGSGINVNVTLIFSVDNYRKVAEAYLSGLELLKGRGGKVSSVASVASFFVSRIDTAVDKELDNIGNTDLKGKIAIANSRNAYQYLMDLMNSERWNKLEESGASIQRLLWASTSTKNPDYPDTLYVDKLIGKHTVNTIPPSTLNKFLDHGKVNESIDIAVDEALIQLERLKELKINLDAITSLLQAEGVVAFAKSYNDMLQAIREKAGKLA